MKHHVIKHVCGSEFWNRLSHIRASSKNKTQVGFMLAELKFLVNAKKGDPCKKSKPPKPHKQSKVVPHMAAAAVSEEGNNLKRIASEKNKQKSNDNTYHTDAGHAVSLLMEWTFTHYYDTMLLS